MAREKLYNPTPEEKKEWEECQAQPRHERATKEHERYIKERSELAKTEIDAEKNFDTLLVTISTVAIGASFTLLKDVVKGTNAWIILAWVGLLICLVGSLIDRIYTYNFHREYRRLMDDVFVNINLHCGHAWKEVAARRKHLSQSKVWHFFRAESFLTYLKWVNGSALILGIIALMLYVYAGANNPTADAATRLPFSSAPVNVNVYNGVPSTQPFGRSE